jgi:hypothetical protein
VKRIRETLARALANWPTSKPKVPILEQSQDHGGKKMANTSDNCKKPVTRTPELQKLYELAKKRAFIRRSMEMLVGSARKKDEKTKTP